VIKRLALLRRRDDFDKTAFDNYWRGPHGDLAKRLPGLAGYHQNSVIAAAPDPAGTSPGFTIDGLAELWFDNTDDMARAFDSAPGRALPADEKAFLDGITILAVTEDVVRKGRGEKKAFLLLAGENANALAAAFRECGQTDGLPEMRACVENRIEAVIANPDLWTEPVPPAFVFELRFDQSHDVRRTFSSASWLQLRVSAGAGCIVGVLAVDEAEIVKRATVTTRAN
jgi:uncharacterized protein (TIGR02118 family)